MLRATLKSLLARKLRLALSTIAVVLAIMFVTGSMVLTDTFGRSFDNLFANVYTYTDIEVSGKAEVGGGPGGVPAPANLPESVVDRVEAVPGVAAAVGQVYSNGARPLNKRGKVIVNQSGQNGGANWVGENELIELAEGRGPTADDEIVINKGLAGAGNFVVGDTMDVLTVAEPRRTFKVVGVFTYAGGRESLGGEFTIFFTTPTAQRLMLGEAGVFNVIDVRADDGVALSKLRDDLRGSLGGDFEVQTGPELAAKASEPLKNVFKYVQYVLLGFAGVILLVGVFLILNTFSIVVAQRTRELALLRAMGASRGQVMNSVLVEAVLIGFIGSLVGFAVGVGVGYFGAWGLLQLSGGTVELAGVGMPWYVPVAAFGIGISVTVVAALVPALKAARVAPIAAMREASAADRPLTRITIGGALVTALGTTALILGLNGAGDASDTLSLILGGVLGLLIGVALLTPFVSRPVVSLLGRLFSWSVPGKLGRRNSARNPRRTAITAAAVMIGIAITTAMSTVFSSLSSSIEKVVDQELQADLVVAGQQTSEVPPVMDPSAVERIRDLPTVQTTAVVSAEAANVNGQNTFVVTYDDLGAARTVLKLRAASGSIDSLDSGEILVDERTAKDEKLKVGDQVRVQLSRSPERAYTLVGITAESAINSGFVVSWADAQSGFRFAQPQQAYVKVRDGTAINAVKAQIDEILADSPEVTVQTREEFVGQSTLIFDIILYVVQILLFVAIAISVLGVVNTLVLSVLERTREIGMLRAVGLRRSQTMRMITVESVVISLFGTLLGLVVGAGLGAAVVRALREQLGFGDIDIPWGFMVGYVFAALIIGLVAAILPAIRAARLNVLGAIAYE